MKECVLEIALAEYGVSELKGVEDNPDILKYFSAIGFEGGGIKDETAWCSAFVNWVHKQAGVAYSGELNARSWLGIGDEVSIPDIGDVVVFWRESPSSWKGHVGLYINEDEKNIYVLGGNQYNSVCIRPYPKHRLLGYRSIT